MAETPEFWNHRNGPGSAPMRRTLLTPVSWIYQSGAALRNATSKAREVPVPVICVGNVTMGGAGKTPMAIAIMKHLRSRSVDAHVLSRGYGGRRAGPLLVDPDKHTYRDVGDEPLLIAREGPTWVAKSKLAGARAAVKAGAEILILDDGFQNPTLHKDLALVLIDATTGLGNGRVFPAGPLREGVRSAMRRADAVILVSAGAEPDRRGAWRNYLSSDAPVLEAQIVPEGPGPAGPVFAFAGIARPEKFFESLVNWGAEVKATMSFPDHHPYSLTEFNQVREAARRHNALLITTEKDLMRLPRDLRKLVHTWPVIARFNDNVALDDLIERAVDRAAKRRS